MTRPVYNIARGMLYATKVDLITNRWLGLMPINSVTSAEITPNVEKQDHFNRHSKVRAKDDSVITGRDYTISISTDDGNMDNLAMIFGGTVETVEQEDVPVTVQTIAAIEPGRRYIIGGTLLDPVGVRNITNVTVTLDGQPLVEHSDYRLNRSVGMIEIIPGGAVSFNDEIEVSYQAAQSRWNRINSRGEQTMLGLLFVEDNAEGTFSKNHTYTVPRAAVTPSSPIQLMNGDDWRNFTMSASVMKFGDLDEITIDDEPLRIV